MNLKHILSANCYSNYTISKALNHKSKPKNIEEIITPRVFLPYIRGTTDKISNILKHHNISTVFGTHKTIRNYLRPIKESNHLDVHGVYEIPCNDCNKTYIGQTNRKISSRIYEHKLAIRKSDTKSTVAQHVMNTQHQINFDHTKTIAQVEKLDPRIVREQIEIRKRDHCMNMRDDGKKLSPTWYTVLSKVDPPDISTIPSTITPIILPTIPDQPSIQTPLVSQTAPDLNISNANSGPTLFTTISSSIYGIITRSRSRMLNQ